jgi:hypothetical protein
MSILAFDVGWWATPLVLLGGTAFLVLWIWAMVAADNHWRRKYGNETAEERLERKWGVRLRQNPVTPGGQVRCFWCNARINKTDPKGVVEGQWTCAACLYKREMHGEGREAGGSLAGTGSLRSPVDVRGKGGLPTGASPYAGDHLSGVQESPRKDAGLP